MNIAAIGALPWKEILLSAPGIVETGRRLYDSLKNRDRQVTEDESTAPADNQTALSDEIKKLQSRLDEIADTQAQLAELITQMTNQEEALTHGLHVLSGRLSRLLWVSGSALVIAVVALLLVFLIRS